MPPILAYLSAAVLYALLGVWLWRTRWLAPARGGPAMTLEHPSAGWEGHALLVPLALHGMALYSTVFSGPGINLGVGAVVSGVLWLTVLVYWIGNFYYGLEALQALIAPVAAVAAVMGALSPAHPLANTELPAFRAHLVVAMMAYSLFTIATLHALLMAVLEKRLHNPRLPPMLAGMPPLLALETLLFRILWAGFVLLTLTLVSGIVFSEEVFGKPVQFTHKTLFGGISWAVYGALLWGRHFKGWRGRTAVRWTIAGFIMLLLAYVGSKFVLEIVLGR